MFSFLTDVLRTVEAATEGEATGGGLLLVPAGAPEETDGDEFEEETGGGHQED